MNSSNVTRRDFIVSAAAFAASTAVLRAAPAVGDPAPIAAPAVPAVGGPKIIDAWGHVSLPRFMSAEEYIALMDVNGVEGAIVGTAATCPDLRELSRAAVQFGDRLRVIGMPMGKSPQERIDCMTAQMECGFTGIRLQDTLIAKEPGLLDIVGKAGGVPYLEGSQGYKAAASLLVDFLERYPECFIGATHFAGPTDPAILSKDAAVARLFRHPRFLVIFSRQGYMDQEMLKTWTRAVVEITGWDRIMYGSEFPVALWRDETYRSTQGWIDAVGLTPTAEERNKFFYANAHRHFFTKNRPAKPIDARWERTDWKTDAPVWLFVKKGVDLPEASHRKIMKAYLAQGGDARQGSYRDYVTQLFVGMIDKM
jgi:predicted TIM-barrel fold metal-dependent hydrolase